MALAGVVVLMLTLWMLTPILADVWLSLPLFLQIMVLLTGLSAIIGLLIVPPVLLALWLYGRLRR